MTGGSPIVVKIRTHNFCVIPYNKIGVHYVIALFYDISNFIQNKYIFLLGKPYFYNTLISVE
jgi:hypothetical protein